VAEAASSPLELEAVVTSRQLRDIIGDFIYQSQRFNNSIFKGVIN
jgi:hypothetical protein